MNTRTTEELIARWEQLREMYDDYGTDGYNNALIGMIAENGDRMKELVPAIELE